MSYELDYFPPKGTKWKWSSKALKYSSWNCDLSAQREPNTFLSPASVHLSVDLIKGQWVWLVRAYNMRGERSDTSGVSPDAVSACLEAEKAGEVVLDELLRHLLQCESWLTHECP